MKINIKAHFDEEKQKHEELLGKAKSDQKSLLEERARKTEAKLKLVGEAEKKKTLVLQNEEEGLEVSKLKGKIQELDSQIADANREIERLTKAYEKKVAVENRSFEREDLMVSVLKSKYHCEEADVVDSLESAFKELPVAVTELDEAGRPKTCIISITWQNELVLRVKPSEKHFWKEFRPATLQWLPSAAGKRQFEGWQQNQEGFRRSSNHTDKRIRVFLDRSTGKFLLSQQLVWREEVRLRDYPYKEDREFKDEFTDLAVCLNPKLAEFSPAENEGLDLDKSYTGNPLLKHARATVIAQTVAKPLFNECVEELASAEIYQRIRNDWDAFTNCPWSDATQGPLALLKYHVENGERVRFWSGSFENQYGFRLRTRDHDWLVGQVFVESTEKASTGKSPVKVHSFDNREFEAVASLGRLFLYVSRDRSERERH